MWLRGTTQFFRKCRCFIVLSRQKIESKFSRVDFRSYCFWQRGEGAVLVRS